MLTSIHIPSNNGIKYKEGNNRPPSVDQISLVHKDDKAGNKCYTQDMCSLNVTSSTDLNGLTNKLERDFQISKHFI